MAIQNAAQDEVSPSSIAKGILSVLSASDFDKAYYRAVALLTIAYTANPDIALDRQLKSNEREDFAAYESIMLATTDKDQILLNGNEVSQVELKDTLIQ